MESFEPKKLALIRIWQILKDYSDYEHPMTQEDIANKLENEYGIIIERKAIGRNISLLKEAGFEIESRKSGCYLSGRNFEDSELHMLIDCVLSSRHISANQSKELIERICNLSNKYFKKNLKHIYSVNDWNKTENQSLFYNIEIIDLAIEQGKQIHYDYNKYGIDKKLRKTSHQYVSPYLMILHNQRYYLMAYSEYWKNIVFHHLDRITNIEIISDKPATPLKRVQGFERGIDFKDLSSTKPYMYTDSPDFVDFIADNDIMDQIIEWFGKDIKISKTDDNNKVKVSVKVSPTAMEYFALQYINHIEVISPKTLRERIKNSLNNGIKKYR